MASLGQGFLQVDLGLVTLLPLLDDAVFELDLGRRGSALAEVHLLGWTLNGLERAKLLLEAVSTRRLNVNEVLLSRLLIR
eukprot:CAMPEP_0170498752 /NCGR_PEP_ID=MMETSP0208-20121228/28829_1 /TAXON_ID=197538 /ORGANISM="Strombidium inclinatum, Strain S3" /LENGTH=79 /DNA_ID=CAMNT_0010776015 /DNA_START=827 /DNA_END=1066 /DNA_ORIENTATION=-